MRQLYDAHGVTLPPPEATRTQVCIIRAIRIDPGAYEWTLAVATNYVRGRANPILELFQDITLLTELHYLQRYVKTSAATKGSKATYARANELVLMVSIASTGFDVDDLEPANQIRSVMGIKNNGDSNVFQVEGIHFLTCLDETSSGFNNNFPPELLSAPHQVSLLSPLAEALNFEDILRIFFFFKQILALIIRRKPR